MYLGGNDDENPCKGMSVGHCDFDEDQVVSRHRYPVTQCHRLCKLDDRCNFWRHNDAKAGLEDECLFLSTNYHQVFRVGY